MTKPLTIGLAFAAMIAGALALDQFDKAPPSSSAAIVTEAAAAEAEPAPVVVRMAQLAVTQPYMFDYERGPRIIHVPQPGERTASRPAARASIERRPSPPAIDEDDDEDIIEAVPPPRPRAVAPAKPRVAATPPQPPAAITPRWKLRSESPPPPPPPPGPRRAVLSAPPPSAEGPTPLRPTPRFDTKAEKGQKFAAPVEPAARVPVVSESQPPLGYSPPATPAAPVMPETPPEETQALPVEASPAE